MVKYYRVIHVLETTYWMVCQVLDVQEQRMLEIKRYLNIGGTFRHNIAEKSKEIYTSAANFLFFKYTMRFQLLSLRHPLETNFPQINMFLNTHLQL